jgi:hypothetical protein
MTAEHRRPFAAFLLLLGFAVVVMGNGLREQVVRVLVDSGAPRPLFSAVVPDIVLGHALQDAPEEAPRAVAVEPQPSSETPLAPTRTAVVTPPTAAVTVSHPHRRPQQAHHAKPAKPAKPNKPAKPGKAHAQAPQAPVHVPQPATPAAPATPTKPPAHVAPPKSSTPGLGPVRGSAGGPRGISAGADKGHGHAYGHGHGHGNWGSRHPDKTDRGVRGNQGIRADHSTHSTRGNRGDRGHHDGWGHRGDHGSRGDRGHGGNGHHGGWGRGH